MELKGIVSGAKIAPTKLDFKAIYDEAHQAGLKALNESVPNPMIVTDGSKEYFVEGGCCGFAWIEIHPARGEFVSWCKKNGIGDKGYQGGWHIWVSEGGQSMTRKEAYASAFAEVLKKYGMNAYSNSRMD